jgi:drug/metabolite transporter (DMT)-like permease
MDYSAHWAKLRNREAPFRTGWAWIVTGLSITFIGALPLLLYIGWENLTKSSGGNPIGLGLLAMVGIGLGQLCVVMALIWIGYGIIRRLFSPSV